MNIWKSLLVYLACEHDSRRTGTHSVKMTSHS